jgi:hypothetical protein
VFMTAGNAGEPGLAELFQRTSEATRQQIVGAICAALPADLANRADITSLVRQLLLPTGVGNAGDALVALKAALAGKVLAAKVDGDNLTVGDVGDGAAVAVGQGSIALAITIEGGGADAPLDQSLAAFIERRRKQQPRVYLAYTGLSDADAALFDALNDYLIKQGFILNLDRAGTRPTQPWADRLFDGLGDCDGALIVWNQPALDALGSWFGDEVSILRRRTAKDSEFRLLNLCLGKAYTAPAGSNPWLNDALAGATILPHAPDAAQIATALAPLQGLRWQASQLSDLEEGVRIMLRAALYDNADEQQINQRLEQLYTKTYKEYLPRQIAPLAWLSLRVDIAWTRVLLAQGLPLLDKFFEALKPLMATKLTAARTLLNWTTPAWVDLRAADLILEVALNGQYQRSFCINSNIPQKDWAARQYLQRACNNDPDIGAGWVVVAPAGKGSKAVNLREIRQALWQGLFGDQLSYDGTSSAQQIKDLDQQIRDEVQYNNRQKDPTILILQGHWLKDKALLEDIRKHFGDVTLFFYDVEPAVAAAAELYQLVPLITGRSDWMAYRDWNKLNRYLDPSS